MYQIGVVLQVCVSGEFVPPGVCWWVYLCHRRCSKPESLKTFSRAPPRYGVQPPLIAALVGGKQCRGASQQVQVGAEVGV